jgi:hypothetical protein
MSHSREIELRLRILWTIYAAIADLDSTKLTGFRTMPDIKRAAKNVVMIGRMRSRLIEQRAMWIERRRSKPEADKMVAEMDRELAINAEQLRAAKEALARAKKAGKEPPPAH